jgi:opine dehydrogenase
MSGITVVGGGNLACGIAGDLAHRGHRVTLYELPAFGEGIQEISRKGGINLVEDGEESFAPLSRVTTDVKEAFENAEQVLIAIPSYGHRAFIDTCISHIANAHTLVFIPGYLGSLEIQSSIHAKGLGKDLLIAETNTAPLWCRKSGPTTVTLSLRLREIAISALPSVNNKKEQMRKLQELYPFTAVRNVLEAALRNINIVEHPPLVLFPYGTERIIESLDQERITVAERYGLEIVPYLQERRQAGDTSVETIHDIVDAVRKKGTQVGNLASRYVTEDIPFGSCLLESLGTLAGVETPVTRSVIDLASIIADWNFRTVGRSIQKMTAGASLQEVQDYLLSGR